MVFDYSMLVRMKKAEFLTNKHNKQRFIELLSDTFKLLINMLCQDDADVLIVKTTVEYSAKSKTVLVGEDIYLLVLHCYYTDATG